MKAAGASKGSPMVKKKGSLSAVIDKLRVTASTGNDEHPTHSAAQSSNDNGKPVQSNTLSNAANVAPSLSVQQAGLLNNMNSNAGKLIDGKLKHNRPEFTVKQSSGGTLKLTVTKTKGQAAAGANNLNALHANKLVSKTSSGIKRQWQSGGNFKNGQSTQKQQQQQQRPLSPESADQILEAALPKIQLDKLPKIPKTASSQNANQTNSSNASSFGSNSASASSGMSGNAAGSSNSGASSNASSLASKNGSGLSKYNSMNKHQLSLRQQLQQNIMQSMSNTSSGQMSALAGALMPPPPISSHYRKFGPRELPPPHLPPPSSSSSVPHPIAFSSVPPTGEHSSSTFHSSHSSHISAPVTSPGSRLERIFASKMDAASGSNDPRLLLKHNELSALSSLTGSSALPVASSSTPSSPLECGSSIDNNPKTPPLIPTERLSLEESGSSDPNKSGSKSVATTSNTSTDAKFSSKTPSIQTIEDDDEDERLLIDVPGMSSSKESDVSKVNQFENAFPITRI
jgi:hypothetical protein